MLKKLIALLVCLALVGSLFIGCSQNTSTEGEEGEGGEVEEEKVDPI